MTDVIGGVAFKCPHCDKNPVDLDAGENICQECLDTGHNPDPVLCKLCWPKWNAARDGQVQIVEEPSPELLPPEVKRLLDERWEEDDEEANGS